MRDVLEGLGYGLGWGIGFIGIGAAMLYLMPGLREMVFGFLNACFG